MVLEMSISPVLVNVALRTTSVMDGEIEIQAPAGYTQHQNTKLCTKLKDFATSLAFQTTLQSNPPRRSQAKQCHAKPKESRVHASIATEVVVQAARRLAKTTSLLCENAGCNIPMPVAT